jgi:hypothetical protein
MITLSIRSEAGFPALFHFKPHFNDTGRVNFVEILARDEEMVYNIDVIIL